MIIDLHAHTTASDGLLPPAAVIDRARARRVEVLAICDHDSVAGIAESQRQARDGGPEVVPGIEISTEVAGIPFHMLGLYVDPDASALRDYEETLNGARRLRVDHILERLRSLGVPVPSDEVYGSARPAIPGRPHIARALIAHGHACSMRDAFRRWLGTGAPAYVSYDRIDAAQAIRLIRGVGGVAVVAHPGLDGLDGHLVRLVEQGIQGVEVYHPDHTPAMREFYRAFAAEHGLVATGGSDFHGDGKEGSDLGENPVPLECLESVRRIAGRG